MFALAPAFTLALRQLNDPAIIRVMAKSIVITLAIFAGLGIAVFTALENYLTGALDLGSESFAFLSILVTVGAGWFLFRIVAIAVLQFFADEIVAAVERRFYPEAAALSRKLPFREDLGNSLRSIARTIGVNLLAIPVALLLIPTGIGPALAFFGANAILLGRELTDMAWLRQPRGNAQRSPAKALERIGLGGAIAGLMLVPGVNLLAPVIGVASGTHLVHRRFSDHVA